LNYEKNNLRTAMLIPNDNYYNATDQWNLTAMEMEQVWDFTQGDEEIIVAIIDSGVADHADLTDNIVSPYDVVTGKTTYPNYASAPLQQENDHGTVISGVIAAQINNGIGIAGIAPNVSIMPINIFSWVTEVEGAPADGYYCYDSDLIDALYYAVDNGADIINLSLGGYDQSSLVEQAIAYATNNGAIVVAAAGNDNSQEKSYPAAYDGVIAVASINANGSKSSFSNYGDYIDVSAAGSDVMGLTLNGYAVESGTSIAAATVTGLAALLKSEDSTLTADDIETIIKETAKSLDDSQMGAGSVQPLTAIKSIQDFTIVSSNFAADPNVEQEIGQTITLSNTVESYGKGNLKYRFTMKQSSDTEWTTVSDWSDTIQVLVTPDAIGEYDFKVERTLTSNLSEDNVVEDVLEVEKNSIETYIVTEIPKQTAANISASQASPQGLGTDVSITVNNESDADLAERAEYKIVVKQLDEDEWTVLKDWSSDNTATWSLTEVGQYTIQAFTRTVGREDVDITVAIDSYVVELPKQKGVKQTVISENAFEKGETATLKASVAESTFSDQAEYQWLINDVVVQAWTSETEMEWALDEIGSFPVEVQARTQGRTGVDVSDTVTYDVVRSPLNATVELSTNTQTGNLLGDPIVLSTQVVTDNENEREYDYEFSIIANDELTVMQSWSSLAEYSWLPSELGEYDLMVELRLKDDDTETVSDVIYNFAVVEESAVTTLTVTGIENEDEIEIGESIALSMVAETETQQTVMKKIMTQIDEEGWVVISDWSTSVSFTWLPEEIGTYNIKVLAQCEGESEYCYIQQKITNINVVDLPKQTGVELAISGTATIDYEQTLTATSTSEATLAERALFKYVSINTSGETEVLQDWSSVNTCNWTTSEADTYSIRAYIKTDGGLNYNQFAEASYQIELPKQEGITIATDATSVEIGETVEISAQVTGDDETLKAQAEYQFIIGGKIVQAWSASSTYAYVSDTIGDLAVEAQVRTQGRTGYDANATTDLTVIDIPAQSGVTLTLNKTSQQPVGTVVKLTGATTGEQALTARAQYRFLIDGVIVRGWSTTATYNWTTSNEALHTLEVQARTQGRTTTDATSTIENYETGVIALSTITMTIDKTSPQLVGQRINLTAVVEGVHSDNAEYSFAVRENDSSEWQTLSDYMTSNTIAWTPGTPGEYTVRVRARAVGREGYDVQKIVYNYVISGLIINYRDYSYSLSNMVTIQMRNNPQTSSSGSWVSATSTEVTYYVNPNNWNSGTQLYQFLTLTAVSGITTSDVNNMLSGKGVLAGQGSAFINAQTANDVNVAYLVSHALLETGNGTSQLATGVYVDSVDGESVTGKTVYNMYGIGAYDSNPTQLGAEYAYKQGWFSVEEAIVEGAYWIGRYYIHRDTYNGDPAQDSIYEMRWNPETIQEQYNSGGTTSSVSAKHQYATDIAWASKQVSRIKTLLDLCDNPILEFDIPQY
jgi:beta-N-acetylglucosaminidase